MNTITKGLALLSLLLGLSSLAVAQTSPPQNVVPDSTELRVLKQLYASTYNAATPWTNANGWSSLANYTTQLPTGAALPAGIIVTNGDVWGLSLGGNNLRGPLPASIGELRALRSLALAGNGLTGPLPATVGNLTNLTSLGLNSNQLTGTLPTTLGQLTNLTYLALSTNQFSGAIPTELGNLVNVRTLYLNGNALTGGIPAALGNLLQLTQLSLGQNQLTGPVPAALGYLPNLYTLNLTSNQLTGPLPPYFFNELFSLNELYLGNNQLTGPLSPALGYLPQLRALDVANNRFSGPLPSDLGQLKNLGSLSLTNNQFSGALPTEMSGCTSLDRVFMAYNQFSGALPASWSQLRLMYLDASNNRFTGVLPASYSAFTGLYRMDFSYNQLSGPLPSGLKAGFLLLANNRFSGALPAGYAQNNWVYQLQVQGNALTSLPDYHQHPSFPNLGITVLAFNNLLDFGSLEANQLTGAFGTPDMGWDMRYVSTQRTPGPADTLARPYGGTAALTRHAGGAHTAYQWERRVGAAWVALAGATDTLLYRGPLTDADEGEYRLRMTNTRVTGTTLYTRSIYLTLLPYVALPFNEPLASSNCPAQVTTGRPAAHLDADTLNYVRTYAARVALTNPAQLRPAVAADSAQVQTTYSDGLGRPVQTVMHRAAPLNRDVVLIHAYDALGREPRAYLPFTAAPTTNGATPAGYYPNAARQQYDFHAGLADTATARLTTNLPKTGVAYAETAYEASPLNRVAARGEPGEAWQLTAGHEHDKVLLERPSVVADSVPQYAPGYGGSRETLAFRGLYPDGALWLTRTSDEDGSLSEQYVDKLGQVVRRRTTANKTKNWVTNLWTYRWLDTWYCFDDFGHPRATVPPLAARRIRANGYVVSGAGADKLLFRTHYDERGRAIETRTPDVDDYATTVYDALDRPILSQDAAQRARGEWLATKYDALGRPVLTALVYYPAGTLRDSLQARATRAGAAPGGRLYELPAASGPVEYYTDAAFPALSTAPTGGRAAQVLSAAYYDGYDFDQNGPADAQFSARFNGRLGGPAPVPDARVTGRPTRTRTRILGSQPPRWLTATTFYDDEARPIQVQASNARGGADTVTTRYDFAGKARASYATHSGGPATPTVGVRDSSTYDPTGRLLTQVQQVDGQPAQTLLANAYEQTGALRRQTLGGGPGHGLQNVDYGYNIRGWLTRLNDAGLRSERSDLWGLQLDYNCNYITPAFNGNIAGQRWRSRADTVERAYGYRYDAANRLLQGDFVARAGAGQSWSGERSDYRFWASSYDDNGNLATLRRRGLVQTGTRLRPAVFAETDNLHYVYNPASQGNRLLAVDDLAPATTNFAATRQPVRPDFKDVAGTTDYGYDAAGSMTSDANKKLLSITYNHLHLPEKLVFTSPVAGQQDSLRLVYAASGAQVAKYSYAAGQAVVRTDYVGVGQYEQDTLRWLTTAAGRALRTVDRTSGAVTYNYEYSLKDHLGNLRVAFRRGERRTYHAGLEQNPMAMDLEQHAFDPVSVSLPIANAEQAAAGNYAAKLFANSPGGTGDPQPIGPTKLWAVQGGDTLLVRAQAHYVAAASGTTWHFALPTFLAGYLANPPAGNPDGASTTRSFNWLQVGLSGALTAIPHYAGVPKAYLRLLVYRADSTVLLDQVAAVDTRAQGGAGWQDLLLPQQVLPTGATYAQVYVANEDNVPVWFDELTIVHWPGLQVQENHYDPFGLDLAGLSRSTPGLKALSQYQWNGKEKQADFGLGWTHLDWRFFDPQTGRFHAVDPLTQDGQESWSTYQFGFDNAVRYNDPDGRAPDKLRVKGNAAKKDEFINTASIGLGGLYNTTVDSKGNVSLVRTSKAGSLTNQQQAFYNTLNNAIQSKKTVTVGLVASDSKVEIGSYYKSKIDVVDVSRLPNSILTEPAALSAQGALAHEIAEQTAKQINKTPIIPAHQIGIAAENSVNQSKRTYIDTYPTNNPITGQPTGQTIQSSVVVGGQTKTVNIFTKDGNITGNSIR